MMVFSQPQCPQWYSDFISETSQTPKAVNLLKIKGMKRGFSFAKAGKMVKINTLTKIMEIHRIHDTLPD